MPYTETLGFEFIRSSSGAYLSTCCLAAIHSGPPQHEMEEEEGVVKVRDEGKMTKRGVFQDSRQVEERLACGGSWSLALETKGGGERAGREGTEL